MSLAARGATRVAPEVLDVGVFLWSSARAGLRRFVFIENRAEVHEAWRLSRPQEAAASGPRRLGASAEEAQPGAARPRWEHVGLGRELFLQDDPGHRDEEAQ